jgi:hypothetical protein
VKDKLMKRGILTAIAAAAALLIVQLAGAAQQKPIVVSVFKSPTCGCCGNWVEHMKAAGFDVRVQDVEDIDAVKAKLGVPASVSSCHTAQVANYIVEGHVPADAVQRLLKERPAVAGLAVPGMPLGSPGMEMPGGRKDPYAILTFDQLQSSVAESRRLIADSCYNPPAFRRN